MKIGAIINEIKVNLQKLAKDLKRQKDVKKNKEYCLMTDKETLEPIEIICQRAIERNQH